MTEQKRIQELLEWIDSEESSQAAFNEWQIRKNPLKNKIIEIWKLKC